MLKKPERLRDLEMKEASSVINTLRNKNEAGERAEMPVLRRSSLSTKRRTYILVCSNANNGISGVAIGSSTPCNGTPSSDGWFAGFNRLLVENALLWSFEVNAPAHGEASQPGESVLALLPSETKESGITNNGVNKTVRDPVVKILFEERSDEFIQSSRFEKVFSHWVVHLRGFLCFFLFTVKKKEDIVAIAT